MKLAAPNPEAAKKNHAFKTRDFLRRLYPRQVPRVSSPRGKISAPRSWSTPVVTRNL
jgi:hypothetical protein